MTAREQLEQEAEQLAEVRIPDDDWGAGSSREREAYVSGYLDGRTITAEQVEKAAKAWSDAEIEAYGVGPCAWSQRDEQEKIYIRSFACAALEAAGLVIEE